MQTTHVRSVLNGEVIYKEPFNEEDKEKCISDAKDYIRNTHVKYLNSAKDKGYLNPYLNSTITECTKKYLTELDTLNALPTSTNSKKIQFTAHTKKENYHKEILKIFAQQHWGVIYKESFTVEDKKNCISDAKIYIVNLEEEYLKRAQDRGRLTVNYSRRVMECTKKYLLELDSLNALSASKEAKQIQFGAEVKKENYMNDMLKMFVTHLGKL